MSGGGGGGGGGSGTVYTDTCYELNHGGAVMITITLPSSSTYYIYRTFDNGSYPTLIANATASGTRVLRVELGYGFHIKVRIRHRATSNVSCKFNLSIDYAKHSGLGARWEPQNSGVRPSKTPICLMKWYVDKGYSKTLLGLLESAFYDQVLDMLRGDLFEKAAEQVIESGFFVEVPQAYAVTAALQSLLEIFGLTLMARFNQVVREKVGSNFLMTVYDYGDGGTPIFTSNLEIASWSGRTMLGEPGYAGEFTDNSTFTADNIYH